MCGGEGGVMLGLGLGSTLLFLFVDTALLNVGIVYTALWLGMCPRLHKVKHGPLRLVYSSR